MSYVVVTDPKTGEKYLDFKKGGGKPKQSGGNPIVDAVGQAINSTPLGVAATGLQMSAGAIGAGIQELQKTGDIGKAFTKGQQQYVKELEGPGPARTALRVVGNAGRNALQEISDVATADLPAMFGAAQPTTKDRPDAPFLGVLPPLPKAKSSGPAEDLVTGIAQVAIEWFPAFKAVGAAGAAAKAIPGVTKATQGAGAAVTALKGTKAAQTLAKVPGAKAVGGALASNTLTKGAATGALIDVTGFDQHESRLYDLVDKLQQQVTGTPLGVPVLSYLRSDPNDVGMAGRLKNALEGAGLGTAVESVFKILRTAKYLNQARQAPAEAKPEAIAKVQEVAEDLENTMVREATQAQEEAAVAALPPAAAPGPEVLPVEVLPTEAPARATPLADALEANLREMAQSDARVYRRIGESIDTQRQGLEQLDEAALPPAAVAPVEQVVADVPPARVTAEFTARLEAAEAKASELRQQLEGLGPEPPKPSGERRAFGAKGKEGADPEVVARWEAENKAYASWWRRYLKLKREEVAASNEAFDLRQQADEMAAAAPEPRAQVKLTATQRSELEAMNSTLMEEMRIDLKQGLTRQQLEVLERNIRIDYASPEQGGIETVSAATRRSMIGLADKFRKAADELPVEQAPAPQAAADAPPVSPAPEALPPAAGPTSQEIQQLDQALAMGRADLSPEQRVTLRDQVLAQKYGTGSPVEPPAAVVEPPATAADGGGDLPPIPPEEPPVVVRSPMPDDGWANKLVTEIQQQNEKLADGSITLDDLLENNVQKIQSPSGGTQYVAVQPDMVQAYRAFADTFSRPEVTGIESMNFDRVRSYARSWLEANGYNGDAIIDNLAPLSGALADAEQNIRALHLSGLYVDYTNKQAGIAANQFLNGKANGGANIAQLTEELLVAAAAQKRANVAFESVTRPIGQLLASTQIPRNLDDAIPGQVMPDPIPSGKDIAGEMEEALLKEQDVPVADSIGMPISEETRQAIVTGVYTPQAMADLDALAQNMAQAAVTPGFARGFWDNFNKSVEIGARGLVMYRSAQLLSSGLTFWRNTINNTVRALQLPLSQALGAGAQLEFSRAGQSLQLYGQYVSNLQNSFRLATESFKVGRGLFDLDSTSVDFLDRLAAQDAAGNAGKLGADAKGEWSLNTLPWVDVQDKTVWGMAQKRLWQALNLSTRLQVSADTFFKSMVGQSFEYVRNLQPGLDHAIQMGMTPGSKEAWGFAEDYARAAVDKSLRDVTVDGKTILDAVMESPHAQTAMRYATFTDDIWAQMQPRTMSYGMDLAAAKGLEGEAAQQFAMEYVQKGSSDVPVFSKTFSLMPGAWQKLIDLSPLFSIIQPFNRTPGDLVKSAARSTPLAPLVDTWWRDINSEDAFTRDRALGDIAIGMGAVSLASMAMTHGRIEFTGGGPVEPTARRKWRDEGKQPYSFRIRTGEDANGNPLFSEWVPMQVFEPVSNLLGALGDYQEIANKLPVEVRERLGSSIVIDLLTAVAAGQMSKTYYQGFMELYEAAMGVGEMDPGPNKRNPAMRFVSRIMAGMVPYSSSLRAGRRYADNELREVPASDQAFPMSLFEETLGEIRNMVPGWSTSLPPRLNWITGEPQVLTGVYGDQFIPADQPWLGMLFQLSPGAVFRGGPKQTDVVMMEMAQLSGRGAAFMGPRNTDFGRELRLNPFQMNDYVTSVATTRDQFGRTLREALLEEISSPRYQELPRNEISTQVMGNRAASLNMVIQGFMKLGKEDFLSKHPEIRDSVLNVEGRNRDVQFRLKYGQPVDVPAFIEGLR